LLSVQFISFFDDYLLYVCVYDIATAAAAAAAAVAVAVAITTVAAVASGNILE
jgi:hypothetical protein